jgi:beta-glucosidase
VVETKAIQKVAVEQSRLGIPMLFALDVIHGYRTVFPIPLAEACSWDLAGIEKNSSVAASEASAAGLHWTFAPMCDISNDIRWGRVMEGAGEDPFYGALVAAARVKGFQGNLDNKHILACVKHFAGYGAVESGREYNLTDFSRSALWNKHLPPYKGAVDAGAATVMNGFNVLDGIPVSGNSFLVNDVLKKKWGFKGILVSDWGSFTEMINWGHAEDGKDAAMKAINAGSMLDMESKVLVKYLPELLKEGKVSMKDVDDAVARLLRIKFQLGLFEQPYKFSSEEREKNELFTPANRQIAREAAKRSIVLLKNENQTLPLSATVKKVALVGSFAESKEDMFDFWIASGKYNEAVSILEGMKSKLGIQAELSFSKGYNTDGTTTEAMIKEAVDMASRSEVVLVNIGISGKMAGEDRALAKPEIPEAQVELLKALQKTGKPVVAIVTSGRPLILTNIQPLVSSILQCWILGTETGSAIADVLMGTYNPSGKTVMTFPYAVGQIPVYYNHFKTGRPIPEDVKGDFSWKSRYRDIPNEPLYPFGYGLSYTSFDYSGLTLSAKETQKGGLVTASGTVKNTGKLDGEEVVQWYIRDLAGSIIRPVKELKGYEKIMLKAGESKTVKFQVSDKELSFFDSEGNVKTEPGKFKVFVGTNSRDVLEADLELK